MARTRSSAAMRRTARIAIEQLEDRSVPAALTYVNDDWAFVTDADASGSLTVGDVVRNLNDTTDTGGVTATYGVDAFGTVTSGAFTGSLAAANNINDAIASTDVGGTVSVLEGTYTENVSVNKNLTLSAVAGRDLTTIQGVSNVGALGTVVVTGGTSAVTIGGSGSGFTIVGIDNDNPAAENAAVYFQGNVSNAQVIGNELVANGDSALVTEFAATVSGLTVSGNVISGTTFEGAVPGGTSLDDQFTTANVPRQLVTISGGDGGGNTSDVTFTNNVVTGVTGGVNAGGDEIGDNLVVIDSVGATITGNTFAGTVFGGAATDSGGRAQLSASGTDATISGNTFTGADVSVANLQLDIGSATLASGTLATAVAANTFDLGTYVANGTEVSVSLIGGAARAAAGSTLRVLPGTYDESLDLTSGLANKALTLAPDAGGAVALTGNLTLGADDALVLDVGGSNSDQLQVAGTVTLGGAALTINASGIVSQGTAITLVSNGGADAAVGTFAGLAAGATITAATGQQFQISYTGGTGNDVVLTALAPPPAGPVDLSVTKTDNSKFAIRGQATTYTIVVTNVSGNPAFDVRVQDALGAEFTGAAWTSVSAGGATGSAGSGTGSIDETVDLPAGASVTYTFVADVSAAARGALFNTVTVAPAAGVTDTNTANNSATDRDTVLPKAVPAYFNQFSAGADAGAQGHVKVFAPDGTLRFSFFAFAGFNGGVRVASGDVTGDGVNDVIVGAGPGAPGGHVKVFDGETGALVASFFTFDGFSGGVDVAAGDVNGDGFDDVIVGSSVSAGHVKVFSLASGAPQLLDSFLAYEGFTGGITVAAGDVNGDGFDDVITGTANAAAHVKAFSYAAGARALISSFIALPSYTGGIDVAAGDLRGDDRAEFLVAPLSAGAGGTVQMYSIDSTAPIASFTPDFPGRDRGVRVATADADNDGDLDIVIAGGPGRGAKLKAFDALSFGEIEDLDVFVGFNGGIYVG